MELRTLRYFVVVAQELNITRAAERLNMSQPPLSNQIKALEEELGAQLLIRGKRYLQLTEAGTLLYRRAVQMLDIAEKTRQEISDLQSEMSGLLSIGCVEGRAPFYLSRCGTAAATISSTGCVRGFWISPSSQRRMTVSTCTASPSGVSRGWRCSQRSTRLPGLRATRCR